jgi:hypothetical protein
MLDLFGKGFLPMEKNYRLLGKIFALLIISACAAGCAVNPYINANYRLSEPFDIPDRQKVYIDFKDVRSDQIFLGKEAQSHFAEFTGRFQLFIDHNDKSKKFVGVYDLNGLFKETLNLRLHKHGVRVLKTKNENSHVMEIELKEFTLDLRGKNWITSIAYAARLLYGKAAYVGENISVTAERQKIWGRKDAEKTLSEAITDAINKLDIQRLFEKTAR